MAKGLQKYNNKFSIDVVWNFGSFVLSGLIFVIINTILLKVYNEDVVGVFNQVFAIYMLLAQLAVAGMHLSVQMYIPRFSKYKRHTDVILSASLITAAVFAIIVTGVMYCFHELPGQILESADLMEAFKYVLWGLVFFALNKVLLAYHNGHRRMKAFAFFSFLRVTTMLITLAIFILFTENTNYIPSLLAFSEAFLFVILLIYTARFFKFSLGKRVQQWIRVHLRYGMKALPGNFLLDANARVDVIMLGLVLDDGRVGVYSFALTFADGMLQIPMIFRNNINPIITKARSMRGHSVVLNKLLKKNRNAFYKIVTPLALFTIFMFPVGLLILGVKENFYEYWLIYSILVGGIALVGGFLPFQMLFNQLGRPGIHSLFIFTIFVTNVIGNLIFIQYFEIVGAAIGTAIALLMQAVMLRTLLRRYFAYRL